MNLNIQVGEILIYKSGDYTTDYIVLEVLPNLIAVRIGANPIWWATEEDIKKYFHKQSHNHCNCWN